MISKAHHYNIFLKLARKHGGSKERVNQKQELEFEKNLIGELNNKESIHGQ